MAAKVHLLSDVSEADKTAACAGCGPKAPVIFKPHKGRWVCRASNSRRSPDAIKRRKKDLTPKARHRYNLASKFGLTPAEYEAMRVAQGGVCAICQGPPQPNRRLSVDHDHQTGRIRGLLCTRCNTGIGLLNDSPTVLQQAVKYLTN